MARSQPTTANGGGSVATPLAKPPVALSVPAFRSLSRSEQRYVLRAAASALIEREHFASRHGLSFDGARDLYAALGYPAKVSIKDFTERYERGDIAETIIEAYPSATWSGGAAVIENPDPDIDTAFELAIVELFDRLNVWSRIERADICAQLGRYSVILIGAGEGADADLSKELPKLSSPNPSALLYLTPLPEDKAKIDKFNEDVSSERFGLPERYQLKLGKSINKPVHWTRVIHVAEGLLVDDVFGKPRLRSSFNRLLDLDKLVGGGSEAAWKRADPGVQVKMDPEVTAQLTDEELKDEKAIIADEWSEHIHGMRRLLYTSGVDMEVLQTAVVNFGANADSVLQLISATTRIPHRILTGSERGELASSQDRDNWADRIMERRREFAIPLVNSLVMRLVDYGYLPKPKQTDVVWPEIDELNESDKADVAGKLATANKAQKEAGGTPIMTGNEIRLSVYDLGPVEDVASEDDQESSNPDADAGEQDEVGNDDADADGVEDEEIRAAESDPASRRIVLIGGPRAGKSTIARAYREQGIPTFCSDPASMVKEPEDGVTYLPDGLAWSESSQYVADNWLSQPAPWCVEGIATARALRKVINAGKLDTLSGIEVVVLDSAHENASPTPAQERAAKGVMTVWNGIAQHFPQARHLRSNVVASQQPATLVSPSLRRLRAAKVQLQAQSSVQRKRMSVRTI